MEQLLGFPSTGFIQKSLCLLEYLHGGEVALSLQVSDEPSGRPPGLHSLAVREVPPLHLQLLLPLRVIGAGVESGAADMHQVECAQPLYILHQIFQIRHIHDTMK